MKRGQRMATRRGRRGAEAKGGGSLYPALGMQSEALLQVVQIVVAPAAHAVQVVTSPPGLQLRAAAAGRAGERAGGEGVKGG